MITAKKNALEKDYSLLNNIRLNVMKQMIKYNLKQKIGEICSSGKETCEKFINRIIIKEITQQTQQQTFRQPPFQKTLLHIANPKSYYDQELIDNYNRAKSEPKPYNIELLIRCINGHNSYVITKKLDEQYNYCNNDMVIQSDKIYPFGLDESDNSSFPSDNGDETVQMMDGLSDYYLTNNDNNKTTEFKNYFLNTVNNKRKIYIFDLPNIIPLLRDRGLDYIKIIAKTFINVCVNNGGRFVFIFKPWANDDTEHSVKEHSVKEQFYRDLFVKVIELESNVSLNFYNSRIFCIDSTMSTNGDERKCLFNDIQIPNGWISSGHDDFVFWYMACIICKPLILNSPSSCFAKFLIKEKVVFMTFDAQVVGKLPYSTNPA